MHAGGGVGCPRTARHHADAGLARGLAIGIGHHRRAAFLAADHELHVVGVVVHRIQHGEETLTRHTEGHVDAMQAQLLDQNLSTTAFHNRYSPAEMISA